MKWEYKTLGDIINLKRGYDLPSRERKDGSVPIVSSSGITGYHNEAQLVGEGVITGRYGTLGEIFYVNGEYWPLNTTLYVEDFKGNHPKFIYYFLHTLDLKGLNGASAVPGLDRNVLHKIKCKFPKNIETQRRIASILSAYDDLIENNLRRIKLLEEAAQHIYREWFVRMRFPGWEGVKFGEDGLPEGWRRVPIKEFGTVITGKTPSTSIPSFYGGDIMFVKTPDMHSNVFTIKTEARLTEEGALSQSNKLLPPFSVMVSCIGTAGVVSITSEQCQTNQQINSVTFDSTDKSLFFYNFSKGIKPLLEGLGSNGATFVNVNKGKFENIEITIPETSLLKTYGEVSRPIFDQILTLQKQNLALQEARDILLPRLMNQTIEV